MKAFIFLVVGYIVSMIFLLWTVVEIILYFIHEAQNPAQNDFNLWPVVLALLSIMSTVLAQLFVWKTVTDKIEEGFNNFEKKYDDPYKYKF